MGLYARNMFIATVIFGVGCGAFFGNLFYKKETDKASEERERGKTTARRYFTFDVLECDINPIKYDLFIRLRNCRGGGNRVPHDEMPEVICSHGVCWEEE